MDKSLIKTIDNRMAHSKKLFEELQERWRSFRKDDPETTEWVIQSMNSLREHLIDTQFLIQLSEKER